MSTKQENVSVPDLSKAVFVAGERVLCFHSGLLYEAKVLKVERQDVEEFLYLIHYHGWSKKWDEFIQQEHVLKYNDANLERQRDLKRNAEEQRKGTKRGGAVKVSLGKKGLGSLKSLTSVNVNISNVSNIIESHSNSRASTPVSELKLEKDVTIMPRLEVQTEMADKEDNMCSDSDDNVMETEELSSPGGDQDQDSLSIVGSNSSGSIFPIPTQNMSNSEYFLKMMDYSHNWELKNHDETKKLLGKIARTWKRSARMERDHKNTYEFSLALMHIRDVGKMLLQQTTIGATQPFDVNLYTDALMKLGKDEEAEDYSCDLAAENFLLQGWRIRKKTNKLNIMPSFTSNQIAELKAKSEKALELKANKPKAVRTKKVFDESKIKNYNEMTKISKAERDELNENNITSVCQKVYKILRSHLKEKNLEEISLVEFALEKTFEETLNNFFYLFFLTKDGLIGARSEIEDEIIKIEHLIIKPKDHKVAAKKAQGDGDGSERFSMVMAFDMKTWKSLMENYQSKFGNSPGIIGKQLDK